MFCNRCGKTVKPEDLTCRHCGATIGDNRFTSASYTSAQPKVPIEASQVEDDERFPSYTRTTYMSEENGEPEGDAFTRTTYRPLLREETADQAEADERPETERDEDREPPESDEAGSTPEATPPAETVTARPTPRTREIENSVRRAEPSPAGEPSASAASGATTTAPKSGASVPRASRLPPVRKAGISPEVRRHMQQLEEERRRSTEKARGRVNQPSVSEEAQDHHAAAGAADAAPEEAENEDVELEERPRFRLPFDLAALRSNRMLMFSGLAVLVLALLIGGVVWVGHVMNFSRAKLPGVTPDTYENGIKLIESYQTTEYRGEMAALYAANKYPEVSDKQTKETAALKALLPATPTENDQAFVDVLLKFKQSIDNAVALDAIAMGTSTDGTLGTRKDASEQDWGLIAQGIATLKTATTIEQINQAASGAEVSLASTPAPEQNTTTAKYSTLRKGMMNSTEVRKLQTRLKELGYFTDDVDGSFGTKTEVAVKRFQSAIGVEIDGVATPALQEKVFADDAPKRSAAEAANTATPAPANAAQTPDPNAVQS